MEVTTTIIEAYRKYHSAGFACVPTSKIKSPAVPKGSKIKGNWENLEDYKKAHGIGLICGQDSGGLECLDFDNHFGDADKILQEFLLTPEISDIYEKYKIPVQSTVSGGFHFIYKCTSVNGGSEKLAMRMNNEGRPDAIIESRGKGNYFVVDPSPGYKIKLNDIFNIPVISVEDRTVLFSVARSFNSVVDLYKTPASEETDRPGDLYNQSCESTEEIKTTLTNNGWKELSEGIWQRPGKNKGISATLGKAAAGIFYCFFSNAHPFELNKGYTAFQVVGLLKYNGDFKAFAKELYEKQNPNSSVKTSDTPNGVPKKNTVTEQNPDQVYSDLEKQLRVDLTADPLPAPALLYLRNKDKLIPSFTLQNFSLITGKAKSRKTFLTVLIVASYLGYLNDLILADPERKGIVLIIDTEQSNYHLHKMMKRICRLIGDENPGRLQAYGLKTLTPEEKRNFIEYKIRTTPELIMIVIDGIRDLVYDINSPEEATKTSVLLMKWCALNNIHILNVLHQNKSDGNARGHLGSELTNKAETVLSVNVDGTISTVECEYSRELDFSTFSFNINEDELPELCNIPENEKEMKFSKPQTMDDQKHYQASESIFKNNKKLSYTELQDGIICEFGNTFGLSICRRFISYYLKKGWIVKLQEGHKVYYAYTRASF